MTETITQLGVGGIFAVLVIREVLGYLKTRKDSHETSETNGLNGVAGRRSTDFWINMNRDIVSKVLVDSVIPILQSQARILDEIRSTNARHTEIMLKLQFVNERIDEGLHLIIDQKRQT